MDIVTKQLHKVLEDTTKRNVYLEGAFEKTQKELKRVQEENLRLQSAAHGR